MIVAVPTVPEAAVNNKARSVGPGHLPAQQRCLPEGVGRSCARGEQILAASAGWVAIVLNVLAGLLALAGVTATEASLAVKKVRQGG